MFAHWIISIFLIIVLTNETENKKSKNSTYCEFYDKQICSNSNRECSKPKKCHSDDPLTTNHCFVTWHLDNFTDTIEVLKKDCFFNNNDCNENHCIDVKNSRKKNVFFCCCHGDMCNKNFTWIPKIVEKVEPKEINFKSPRNNENVSTILMSISLSTIVVIIVILTLCCKLKRKIHHDSSNSNEKFMSTIISPCPNPINLLELKSHGNFGDLWKAKMSNSIVAAKIFSNHQREFWQTEKDVYQLPHMKHDHVLEFIGHDEKFQSLQTELWIVTVYHEKGSLSDYLRFNVLTMRELWIIAKSVLRGLSHLHEEIPFGEKIGGKPSIAHRDLKTQNILLKSNMEACIADFGLSLMFDRGESKGCKHNRVGTRRYMAPEVLQGAIDFDRDAFFRIDMYACGLVLWELISRCIINDCHVENYRLPFENEVGTHPTLDDMLNVVVHRGQRPGILNGWLRHSGLICLCETMEECWDVDSEARPSASCVYERICQYLNNEVSILHR